MKLKFFSFALALASLCQNGNAAMSSFVVQVRWLTGEAVFLTELEDDSADRPLFPLLREIKNASKTSDVTILIETIKERFKSMVERQIEGSILLKERIKKAFNTLADHPKGLQHYIRNTKRDNNLVSKTFSFGPDCKLKVLIDWSN
jgi:hypothetical protein